MLYHQIGAYQVPSQGSYLISLSLFSHLRRVILFGLRTVLPQHLTKCRCPVRGGLVLDKVEWLEAQNVEDTSSEPLPDVLVIDYVVMLGLDWYWSFLLRKPHEFQVTQCPRGEIFPSSLRGGTLFPAWEPGTCKSSPQTMKVMWHHQLLLLGSFQSRETVQSQQRCWPFCWQLC